MNEAELVAETIATIKRDGWVRGWLAHPDGSHCILGAIGRARWGDEFDSLVLEEEDWKGYGRLQEDRLTDSVVKRIHDLIRANYDEFVIGGTNQAVVYNWNDHGTTEQDVIDVLEKVQAEIG